MAMAAIAISIRAKARNWRWPSAAAISPPRARCRVAATNNLNFGNPERPEIMAQLVEAIEGIAEACAFFETPITGGNVSLYNETLGEGDLSHAGAGNRRTDADGDPAPVQFPEAKGAHLLAGRRAANAMRCEFGRHAIREGHSNECSGALPPQLDMAYEKRVHDAMREILGAGLAESAHDFSDGGLAVALSECCTDGRSARRFAFTTGSRRGTDCFSARLRRASLVNDRPEAVPRNCPRIRVECTWNWRYNERAVTETETQSGR